MDPNANLDEQRRLTEQIRNMTAGDLSKTDYHLLAVKAERLAELVQALDEWMHRGGFAPADWQSRRGV